MHFCTYFLLGLNFIYNVHATTQPNPTVKTHFGPIMGSIMQTVLEKTIYAFRGIRYAKAPINDLRFQPPVPIEAWTDIYDATKDGAACPQPDYPGSSEDCLFLNVYSTKLPDNQTSVKRPVIVYIHPGGFYGVSGTSEWAGPEYYLDQNIVLVTLNYRLGSLGFISTGDPLAPGNNGLKDQVIALRWVKSNIAAFGGDPSLITIAGYSAGGVSVSLHLVSPMSRGLFQRAIIMSGSIYSQVTVPRAQFNLAQKQAQLVGCPNDTSSNIINCLKTKSAKELGDSLYNFYEFGSEPMLIWYPVIEEDFGQERFLTENSIKLMYCGGFEQVPIITTVTKDEFAYHAAFILRNPKLLQEMNDNFEEVAPISFIYERDTANSKHISKMLKEFYFGNASITNHTKSEFEKLFADGIIGFSTHRTANLLARKSTKNVYYYLFNFHGRYSHIYIPGTKTPYGVVHHDDLIYLFYISPLFPKFNTTDPEFTMVTKLTTLFANFARTGKPTPASMAILDNVDWKPYTLQERNYLDISNKLTMKKDLFKERYAVWDKLFPIYDCQD